VAKTILAQIGNAPLPDNPFKAVRKRDESIAKEIMQKFGMMQSGRGVWDTQYQQIAQVILPNARGFNNTETPGSKLMDRVYDNTPVWANEQLAGALSSQLVNPFQRWFQFRMNRRELNDDYDVQLWLDDAENVVYDVFSNPLANFNSQAHSLFLELTAFGTAGMFVEPTPGIGPGIKYTALPLRKTYYAEGANGIIDTAFVEIDMSVKQAIQFYGEENCSKDLRDKLEKKPFETIQVVMAIFPRLDRIEGRFDNMNKKWASFHVEARTNNILKESGFDFFPILVPRWSKRAGETYGRSPGMTALPDANMLNEQMRMHLRMVQKLVDPPLLMPDDGYMLPIRTAPSSINFFRTGLNKEDHLKPLRTEGNWPVSQEEMEQTRGRIMRAFHLDMLKLAKENKEMTRTEALIRKDEDQQQMAPTVGRLETEFLNQLLDITVQVKMDDGTIPPPPRIVEQEDTLGIEYVSTMARAQRADESNAVLRSIETIMPLVQGQPELMDNFNGDEIVRATGRWFGVPQKFYNPKEEVEAMREQRLQQEQQMAEQEEAAAGADIDLKNAKAQAA